MSSLRALHALDSPVYGSTSDGFMLRSSVQEGEAVWRLEAVTCSPEQQEPLWYETTLTKDRLDKVFKHVERPAGCITPVDAIVEHLKCGTTAIEAIDGDEAATVSFGSADIVELRLQRVRGLNLSHRFFVWLKECSQSRIATAKEAAVLARNAAPARVAQLEDELKRSTKSTEQLRAKLESAERLGSGSQLSQNAAKARGPPPAKKQKGEVNLGAAGKRARLQTDLEFGSDSDDADDPDKTDEN